MLWFWGALIDLNPATHAFDAAYQYRYSMIIKLDPGYKLKWSLTLMSSSVWYRWSVLTCQVTPTTRLQRPCRQSGECLFVLYVRISPTYRHYCWCLLQSTVTTKNLDNNLEATGTNWVDKTDLFTWWVLKVLVLPLLLPQRLSNRMHRICPPHVLESSRISGTWNLEPKIDQFKEYDASILWYLVLVTSWEAPTEKVQYNVLLPYGATEYTNQMQEKAQSAESNAYNVLGIASNASCTDSEGRFSKKKRFTFGTAEKVRDPPVKWNIPENGSPSWPAHSQAF